MSSGKKPSKPKVEKATSQFNGVNQANFSSDFGTGSSVKTGNTINTTSQLADFLQPIPELAGQGIQGNLNYLQQTPQQQYEQAIGGNNPLYNLLSMETQKNTNQALGRAMVNNQGTGTMNSTTAGSAQGRILNDQLLRANTDLLNAVNFSNQTSRDNLGANLNALGSMANLSYPLASAANANLMQSLGAQDQVALANAQAQNAANLQYAQQMQQYQQERSKSLGGTIGGAIGTAAAIGLAPFTGGASLLAVPGTLSMMGGSGGSSGGGTSYAMAPSYGFSGSGGSGYYSPGINSPNFTNLSIS